MLGAMAARWTVDQVLRLAPDAASATAARRLARAGTWSDLGSTESLVWGRCQGSAKDAYQVTVDLAEPGFRCSCPSRKLPCKHGLALLLLWAAADGAVADAGAAAEWATRPGATGARPAADRPAPDPEARARRVAERVATMSAGIDDFERWLLDVARQGLAETRRQPFAFWDAAAARLVDAQLPGLAERVRIASAVVHGGDDWPERLLAELGRWWLAVRAWRRRDELPPDLLADLRVVLGWSRRSDELAEEDRVADRWLVVGRRLGGDDRLQSQRTWLAGEATGEVVVVLDFAAAGASLPVAQVVGTVVDAVLALHPGARPRRAVFTGDPRAAGARGAVPGAATVDANLAAVAGVLAANPWAQRFPVALAGAVASVDGGDAWVADGAGRRLPLDPAADPWPLLAVTGGHPADLFGEWEDGRLHPASVVAGGELVAL